MKVFALTLVAALLIGGCSAVRLRKTEDRSSLEEASAKPTEDEPITEISESDVDQKEKEVHKRGVFHYGGLTAHTNPWPKSYAAHYGYGLHLPATSSFSVAPVAGAGHVHVPGALRYNTGFHYRTLSSPGVIHAGVPSFSAAALPTLTSLSPAVPHVHHGATATPFVIRPGGAVVQSYSVNYPHHKPAVSVKPVHAFASVAPVQPVQPVHTFQTVQASGVQPVQHVHAVQSVQPVHEIQSVQPLHAVQHVQQVQPVQPIQPVQPVQAVVQTFFQPAPAPAVPAIPQVPAVPLTPAQPAFPEIPTFPNTPDFPTLPAIPATPTFPPVPNVPAIPSVPTIPSISQPQFPTNGFFPVNVQPPLPQQPPNFFNFNPAVHVPGLVPVAGTPNQNNPDIGSAEAAPQIPVQPAPLPEVNPEKQFPTVQPQPTQQPWKPVFNQPPSVDNSDVNNRPSNTLLPPYGNSPAEGYLPPAQSSPSQKQQQEFAINSQLFDNLSDTDIQHIFHQANLAAQRDHNHAHTIHTYRSHY